MLHSDEFVSFFTGAAGLGVIAHAVNTFPTPDNKYARWFLGVIQMIVGQRTIASNTLQGMQTDARAITTEEKKALQNVQDVNK